MGETQDDLIGYDAASDPCPVCGAFHQSNESHGQDRRVEPSEEEVLWESQWNDAMDELGRIEELVSGESPPVGVSVYEQVQRLHSITEELAELLREQVDGLRPTPTNERVREALARFDALKERDAS